MRTLKLEGGFARLDAMEARLCVPCNEVAQIPAVRDFFRLVSRLGDGMAWYSLLLILPVTFGGGALLPVASMAITALAGVVIYKILKETLVRERPFASHFQVKPVSRPLDRYSFPSGHTMHAAAFLTQLASYFPAVMWLMLPFGIAVAMSRVVLGLHYPSDVLAGALLGWVLAAISLSLLPALLV